MKLTTFALCLAALALPAQAANLQLTNLQNPGGSIGLLDNEGVPITSGFMGLYAFGAADGAPPTDAAAAVLNGNNGLLGNVAAYNAAGGPGSFFVGFGFTNDGSVIGQNLYVMYGDGADAASSVQIGLVNLGISPDVSDSPPPGWVPPITDFAGAAVIGSIVSAPAGTPFGSGIEAEFVPEPSSTMLFGLAGLALFIRRKR